MSKTKRLSCESCEECEYICEGDFACLDNRFNEPDVVLTDFSIPTKDYMRCKKLCKKNITKQNLKSH